MQPLQTSKTEINPRSTALVPMHPALVRDLTHANLPVETQLMRNSFSIFEKMLMGIQHTTGLDIRRFTDLLPPNFLKMLKRIDQIMQITLADDEEDTLMLQVSMQFDEALSLLARKNQEQLLLAKVGSHQELIIKRDQIAEYKAQAGERYLKDPTTIHVKIGIDEQMVVAKKGELAAQDQVCIHQFWHLVCDHPRGYALLQQVENRAMELFIQSLFSQLDMDKMIEMAQNQKGFNHVQWMKDILIEAMQNTAHILSKETKNTDATQAIVANYLLLKGSLIMPIVCNFVLRMQLMPLIEKQKNILAHFTQFWRENNQRELQFFQDQIEKEKKKLAEARLQKNAFRVTWHEKHIAMHEEQKARYVETEEDFVAKAQGSVKTLTGISLADTLALLPKETPFERRIIAMFNLESLQETSNPLASLSSLSCSEELQVDLAHIPEPLVYFLHKMQQEDKHTLELFK